MTKAQKAERDQAIEQLRGMLKPGDTVYTVLDHVSASGMFRAIRVVVPYIRVRCPACGDERRAEDCTPTLYVGEACTRAPECPGRYGVEVDHWHPNYAVGRALDLRHWKQNGREQDALVVGGCGMDMGFHIVYNLGRVLFPDGFKVEGRGRNGDTSGWDKDGGYALNHRWL